MKNWGTIAIILLTLGMFGCTTELYHGLNESEANDMVVALEEVGINAGKERDPSGEAAFMVVVPSGEKGDAWRILRQRGLPRPDPQGFGAFYPSDGLVPTAGEERVLLQYATAQEIRHGLLTIDGVVDAHVNLVLPDKPRVRLSNDKPEPPRASVVITHAVDKKAPLKPDQVKAIVAGGVEGMSPDNVRVIISKVSSSPVGDPRYEQVGPISVAPSNQGLMQILFGGMVFLIMILAGAIVFLVVRK